MNLNLKDAIEILELGASLEIDIERCSDKEVEKLVLALGESNSLVFYNCENTNMTTLKKLASLAQGKVTFKFK